MDAQEREYQRFGPWSVEITAEDPVPHLFEPYLARADPMLLGVKVPRHIERRNARPGMDLYDYAVCLYEDDLVVLRRDGREVRSETCRYADVQHVRVTRSLLFGDIHLALPGRAYDLRYNTVSDGLMQRVVDVVRQRYGGKPPPVADAAEPEVRSGMLSFNFERRLARERRERPGLRLVAVQGTLGVRPRMSAARRTLLRIADKRLLESMHLSDGRELVVISRGKEYAYRWDVLYRVDTSFMPLANISDASWEGDERDGVVRLALRTGADAGSFIFAEDNPSIDPYAAFLSALASGGADGQAPGSR
jgi:hypothetical protein